MYNAKCIGGTECNLEARNENFQIPTARMKKLSYIRTTFVCDMEFYSFPFESDFRRRGGKTFSKRSPSVSYIFSLQQGKKCFLIICPLNKKHNLELLRKQPSIWPQIWLQSEWKCSPQSWRPSSQNSEIALKSKNATFLKVQNSYITCTGCENSSCTGDLSRDLYTSKDLQNNPGNGCETAILVVETPGMKTIFGSEQ